MAEPRTVAGISCFEVLAQLSDYVDGTLSDEARRKIEAHLAGCDACSAFGGEFTTVLEAARRVLGSSADTKAR